MNFEQFLLSKQISTNKLSKLSGVPRTTILDIIRGRSNLRKAAGITLYRIAKALGVSIEYLIELDSPFEINSKTGKPQDCSYFEFSSNKELTNILRNLKNAIYQNNESKQIYWKDILLEEITSLARKDEIGLDSYEYFCNKYLKGNRL